MQPIEIFFIVWGAAIFLVPSGWFIIGGLLGYTLDELIDALPCDVDGCCFGLFFWPITLVIIAIVLVFMVLSSIITYLPRRNQDLREGEARVSRRLSPTHRYEENILRQRGISEQQQELLKNLPWREAEAYLKRKGVL